MKDFYLGREGYVLQFRGEASNVLNHVNAGMPDVDLTRSSFGVIRRVAGGTREITVAARFWF